jgi:insulysin
MISAELQQQFKFKLRFKKRPSLRKVSSTSEDEVLVVVPKEIPQKLPPLHLISNIRKSQQDSKIYRGMILPNGMKVMLISDPTTSKSSACMSIQVGHMNDPADIPGIAHLMEHSLLLGSENFCDSDNDFRLFLSENGGHVNAQTFADVTKYFFEIVPNKLHDAIERFADMFIAPLFDDEAVMREINAVNSEHEKNLASDSWRVRMVNKKLAIWGHSYGKFGTGNKKTLGHHGIDIVKELKEFHKSYYTSGNMMNLAILGRERLDELQAIVEKFFGKIEDKKVEIPVFSDKIYSDDMMSTRTYIIPVQDVRTMTMQFTTSCFLNYYKSKVR